MVQCLAQAPVICITYESARITTEQQVRVQNNSTGSIHFHNITYRAYL